MRWNKLVVLLGLVAVTPAEALPPKPSIAQGIKDAKFSKKVSCKAAAPARVSSQNALYQNTRTKEIVSKKEHWATIEIECRTFDAIPGHPKAIRKFDGRFVYKSLGGKWMFDSWVEWDVWLEGMPPLDASIVEKGIADRLKILDWNRLMSTTKIYSYGVRKDAPMRWADVDKVKADVEAEVDTWDGPDLVRSRVVVPVMFRQETPGGPWVARPGAETRVEISRRTPTEAERKKLVNVIASEKQRLSDERLAMLPAVQVPSFTNAADARAYVYKQLVESTTPELEASLRRMYATIDEEQLAAALAGHAAFKEQYCKMPAPKSGRQGFVNKDGSSWTEVSVSETTTGEFKDGAAVSGGFRLDKLSVGLVTGDKLAALKSYSYDLCTSKPPTPAATPAPGSTPPTNQRPDVASLPFKEGDRVEGAYGGGTRWFKGTVKSFNSARTKAFIRYDDGTSEYLPFDKIRKL